MRLPELTLSGAVMILVSLLLRAILQHRVRREDWLALWAREQGVVQGVSDTRFAPNDPVTREQIATILLRFAKMTGQDDGRRTNVSGFPDAGSISSWALEGIRWAKAAGILNG